MISLSNQVFPKFTFTASAQTQGPLDLSPNQAGYNGAYNCGNLTVIGTGLSTVSFQVLGSSDGGQTYNVLLVYLVNSLSTSDTTTTATGNGLYRVNLAGITTLKITTSGTFTATSVTIQLTASPNASDS
jgi:energy-converting hydrogenase Eha subunit B